MNLLNYIDLNLKNLTTELSESLSKKTGLSRSALKAYLSTQECDLRHSVFTDFFLDFGRFLSDKQGKNYTPNTVREILRTLRKYIRSAIYDGFVPNIDTIPSVIEKLNAELWTAGAPDLKKTAYVNRYDFNVTESVSSMTRYLDAWSTKQKIRNVNKTIARVERNETLDRRCAAIYLFCLLTCGIEVKDALAIRRDWDGSEIPDSVYVERFGDRLPLSPTAKKLVEIYNRGAHCTEHLFFTLDNKKYGGDLDRATALIEDRIFRYLSRRRMHLYRKKSVFIDWLNYAIENGLPDSEAELLWRNHLDNRHVTANVDATIIAKAKDSLDETWYLLSILPLSVKRDRFLKMLISSGILGEESEAKKCIYVPEDKYRDKRKGEYAVFTRYIFFRGTSIQAEYVNSFSPYAYVVKDVARAKFARIHESELANLQIMLRDFPDAVQLVDSNKWLAEHNAKIVEGCKAIIRSGSLVGKEVKVVRIQGKQTAAPTYFIEYVQGNITFKSSLAGILLDIVPA